MTVEPGFGGQKFMSDAAAKIGPAHLVFGDRPGERPSRREVHVDGGVNRNTAEVCGSLGVEVMVVGSTLWKKGRSISREIKLIKSLADGAYRNRAQAGGASSDARAPRASGTKDPARGGTSREVK
jgi:ribulose-phosphate 3-epimerase